MSTTSAYSVKRKVTGGYVVSYACPHCNTALTSTLDESGTVQHCPTCNGQFPVPGKAERDQLKTKQEAERHAKEQQRLQQEQEAKKAAEAKRLARIETDRINQLAKQDAAAQAKVEEAQEQKRLLAKRGRAVLDNRDNTRQPIALQLVKVLLLIDAALSAVFALFFALTVIGLPIAGGLLVNFAIAMGFYYLLEMLNNIRHASNESVEHLRFQSSALAERLEREKHER